MSSTTDIFSKTVQQSHEWLLDLMDELGWTDERKAQRALKACLHALRDRLTVTEAVDLGAQLPTLLRGMYYEGWRPAQCPLKERKKEEFLAHILERFRPQEPVDAEKVASAAFAVLSKRVTNGEIEDVRHILPREVRDLWY